MDTDPNSTPHTTAGLYIEESDDEDDNNNSNDIDINNNTSSNINTQELIDTQNTDLTSNTQYTENTENILNDNNNNTENNTENKDNSDDLDSDNGSNLEVLSISEAITLLTIAWRNEKLAPEILQYEDEVIDTIKIELDAREDEIDDKDDEIKSNMSSYTDNKILSSSNYWYKKEIERIKYILHSYLRIRIWKIQKYTLYLLSDTESYNRLSLAEQNFVTKYSELNERHFKHCFLRELPQKYQSVTETEMFVKPNLNKYVVIKANDNADNVIMDGGNHVNLQKGNIFVARYNNFKHLVALGTVDLI